MTAFDYLSVLFSIIMGLALANLLGAAARLMHARERVKTYWPALVWAGWLFIITVQHWWAEFSLSYVPYWSFAAFFVVLLTPVTLYLLCDLVLPHHTEEGVIELQSWYFANRQWLFGLLFALPLWSFVEEYVVHGAMHKRVVDSAFLILFALLSIFGFVNRSRRGHEILAVIVAAFVGAYIGILFWTLPK